MLNIDRSYVYNFTNSVGDFYKTGSSQALPYMEYLKKSMNLLYEGEGIKYPQQIRFPKSMPELLAGDFEPARVLTLDKPLTMADGTPFWFGSTAKEIMLDFGYKNGDNRYLSTYNLGDAPPHGILAGTSGSGKSVTANSLLFNAMFRYAPWELEIHLSDAKIVEFKRYATCHNIPHIATVAATADPDYTISMLEALYSDMQKWNSIFTLAGAQNIKDFRKNTGLAVPRKLVTIDEFQFLFLKAGSRLKQVLELIDIFARAGRNSGYHLFLASQSLDSSMPQTILDNIGLRACLRCSSTISERVLGNDASAKKITGYGQIFVTKDAESKDALLNTMYKVPFQDDKTFNELGKFLEKVGKSLDVASNLRFYDEEEKIYEEDYESILATLPTNKNRLYLGEPSFISQDNRKLTSLDFDGDDIENLLFLSNDITKLKKYALMMKFNINACKDFIKNIGVLVDLKYESDCEISQTTNMNLIECNDFESDDFKFVYNLVPKLKMLVTVDKLVFEKIRTCEEAYDLLNNTFGENSSAVNETNASRATYMMALLGESAEFQKYFDLEGIIDWEHDKTVALIVQTIAIVNAYGLNNSRTTQNSLPTTYVWVLGLDKLYRLGRDNSSKAVDKMKKVLLDSTAVNVKFMIFTKTMEDMQDLRTGLRYMVLDGVSVSEASRLKVEDMPETVDILGMCYDSINKSFKKFKRISLESERIVPKNKS